MNPSPPTCPAHGTLTMPMLRPGCWWCPKGWHLVTTGTASQPTSITKAA